MNFTEQNAQSLGAKLEALDLNDGERAALDAVFVAAAADEVAGFQFDRSTTKIDLDGSTKIGLYQKVALGLFGDYVKNNVGFLSRADGDDPK